MKKLFKILLKIFLVLAIVFFISIFFGYWWVSTKWKDCFSVEKMKSIGLMIDSSKALPNNYYQIYDAVYPEQRNNTMTDELWGTLNKVIFNNRSKNSPCKNAGYLIGIRNSVESCGEYSNYFFGWGIERYTTPKKCFDFVTNYEILHLKEVLAQNSFYRDFCNKPIEEMNQDEIIELMLLLKAPTAYNKYLNPKRFERAFNELKNKINAENL